jgi:hypothetical protein
VAKIKSIFPGYPVYNFTVSIVSGPAAFIFTKYLQDTFDCPLVIQIADEPPQVSV